MGKRNYTHVQVLLPEIKAMLAEGKTQRRVAEYYGFRDKQVVKRLLERERRKRTKVGSRNSSAAQRAAEERCCTKKHCGGAGIRDSTLADGKQTAAGFSALHRKEVRAQVKYHIIYRHRTEYPRGPSCASSSQYPEADTMLSFIGWASRRRMPPLQRSSHSSGERSFRTYGYRRMWLWLKSQNIFRTPQNRAANHEEI